MQLPEQHVGSVLVNPGLAAQRDGALVRATGRRRPRNHAAAKPPVQSAWRRRWRRQARERRAGRQRPVQDVLGRDVVGRHPVRRHQQPCLPLRRYFRCAVVLHGRRVGHVAVRVPRARLQRRGHVVDGVHTPTARGWRPRILGSAALRAPRNLHRPFEPVPACLLRLLAGRHLRARRDVRLLHCRLTLLPPLAGAAPRRDQRLAPRRRDRCDLGGVAVRLRLHEPRVPQGNLHGHALLRLRNEQLPQEVPAQRAEVRWTPVIRRRAGGRDLRQEATLLHRCGPMRVAVRELCRAGAQVGREQRLPNQHLVQRDSGRPHVHRLCLGLVAQDLGSHVLERTSQACRRFLEEGTPSKVGDLQDAPLGAQEIVGLDIAVKEAESMQRLQAQEQLPRPHGSGVLMEALQRLRVELPQEVALLAKLEQEEHIVILLSNVEQLHDMPLHAAILSCISCHPHRLDFRLDLLLNPAERKIRAVHNLHREALVCVAVPHFEDLCERSPTQGWCVRAELVLVTPDRGQWRWHPGTEVKLWLQPLRESLQSLHLPASPSPQRWALRQRLPGCGRLGRSCRHRCTSRAQHLSGWGPDGRRRRPVAPTLGGALHRGCCRLCRGGVAEGSRRLHNADQHRGARAHSASSLVVSLTRCA
mmetsp:Transcript_37510/g.104278  ORF Transcript_37510/g.104278 Transcript_37510/m.104278 type:complete len:643 (-) Transcript_37510:15-1943(-)